MERELARVTEEIEQMEGERRFYDHQVALSTIALTLQEPAPAVTTSALSPLGDALRASLEMLSISAAAIVYGLSFSLPWVLVALVSWKLVRMIAARRAAVAVTSGGTPDARA